MTYSFAVIYLTTCIHCATLYKSTEAFAPTATYGIHTSYSYTPSLLTSNQRDDITRKQHSSLLHSPLFQSAATAELAPGINSINKWNDEIREKLDVLRDHPYFRLYSVDMLGSCEYMPQELFECYSQTCEIFPVDEDEVRGTIALECCFLFY
jgi:hypothetical protein